MFFKHKKFISFLLILCTVFSMCSQFLTVFAVDGSGIENEIAEKGNISDYSELNDIGLSETEAIKPNDALLTIDHPSIAKESMISKYVNAEAFNKASHVERLHSEEDLNTYVFLNANGTKSIYYMDENVKYVDKNGDVKEKDISLVSKSDGYGIVRNEFDLHIPISATSGISMSYNGYEVKITPQSTARTAPARQAGETVVYDGFFGTNTSLVYTPMLSGIKEDVIMKAYIPNAEFSFVLDTDGLGLYNNNEGYYLAESESSKAVLRLGKVIIYDAVGKPEYGTMAVKTVAEGQKYILSLSAPEEFLTDPTTVYPVTIDPPLTVSDTATGDGAIEDTVLFSNRPSKNYGDYKYLSIGYVDSTYGAGRVAVKLPGLYNSVEYQNITASEITSVKFYCRDSSGNSAQNINLYRITSAAWNENTVTYGDSVTYSTATNWGTSLPNAVSTAFDITTLVKGWKNGTYAASKGFILINPNETSASYKKAPYSSEYTTTSYRPYVVFTYDPDDTLDISDGNKTADIIEGGTRQLTASNPYGMGYTWTSSNTAVATVSSTGMVSAHKAGKTTITASFVFNGDTYNAPCTVYVCIADAVYYIKNNNSNLYLNVQEGKIKNYTNVYQWSEYSDSANVLNQICQIWKIKHIGEGKYSIRPFNKLDMGLDVTNTNVDIYYIGTTDTLNGVPIYAQWSIEWYSTGYIIKSQGSNEKTLQIENASTSVSDNVVVGAYNSTSNNQRWTLTKESSPPSGAYWYNTNTETTISGISATKTIVSGSSTTASNLGLVPIVYSPSANEQSFSWSSNSTGVANVNPSSGLISTNNAGDVIITATSLYGNYTLLLNLTVKSSDPFHQDNIQYMRYTRITGENWWGLGSDTDHTINIVKSTMYSDDYCIIHDNINTGHYREIYINDELKNTLNNLEAGYQEHYSWLPLLDTTTNEENAAHSSKEETDQLVEEGYFSSGSSEYYGAWAYNYVSSLNLADYWRGIIDTATAAYGVYLTATSFYYSYLMTTSTTTMQVSSSQYGNTTSILDDIDDAMSGMSYRDKTTISAEARNNALGLEKPPYKVETPVVGFKTTETTQFVRVYKEGVNSPQGDWLMKLSDIQGLTPAQIKDKFALPNTPTHYCYVNVPAGVQMYTGVAGRIPGWGNGGGLQFELGQLIPAGSYSSGIPLP